MGNTRCFAFVKIHFALGVCNLQLYENVHTATRLRSLISSNRIQRFIGRVAVSIVKVRGPSVEGGIRTKN